MAIYLLDNSLKVDIYYEEMDESYGDNVCISLTEDCPEEEKLFRVDQTNIYLTPEEACQLAKMLQAAARRSSSDHECS
jgi:hypothetical protein